MPSLRYTICSYAPDLARMENARDFAVVVASESQIALAGVDLSTYCIEHKHQLAQLVIDNTCDAIMRRIRDACEKPDVRSGFDALDTLVANNRSSLIYRPL